MDFLSLEGLAGIALATLIIITFEVVRDSDREEQKRSLRRFVLVGVPLAAFCLWVGLTRDSSASLAVAGKTLVVTTLAYAVSQLMPALLSRLRKPLGRPARFSLRRLAAFDRWFSPASSGPALDELDPRRHPREP